MSDSAARDTRTRIGKRKREERRANEREKLGTTLTNSRPLWGKEFLKKSLLRRGARRYSPLHRFSPLNFRVNTSLRREEEEEVGASREW